MKNVKTIQISNINGDVIAEYENCAYSRLSDDTYKIITKEANHLVLSLKTLNIVIVES